MKITIMDTLILFLVLVLPHAADQIALEINEHDIWAGDVLIQKQTKETAEKI